MQIARGQIERFREKRFARKRFWHGLTTLRNPLRHIECVFCACLFFFRTGTNVQA